MKRLLLAAIAILICNQSFAVQPQFWEDNTQQNFSTGDPQSVSINSDGELTLAPQLKKVYFGSDPILWKIVRDSKGNLYAATGNEGKVIRIDSVGLATTVLDCAELEIHALLLDSSDNLYAASSPDGKIYKIKPDGTSKTFFDPEDKYIWDLAIDDSGNLYAGTGDQGKIYKIDSSGNGTVLLDTNESNITALNWSSEGKLLAGSDHNGILYSVEPGGRPFVLFDSDLEQVTSIYSRPDGLIFFSVIAGIPQAPVVKPQEPVQSSPLPSTGGLPGQDDDQEGSVSVEVSTQPTTYMFPQQPQAPGASQLYRITPDGFPELIYTATEDQILDIIGYVGDSLLISTGKRAKIISVDQNKKSTILVKAPEDQITSLLSAGGKVWAATANPGSIYELAEDFSASGTYYSDVKDAHAPSIWGLISWKGSVPQGTTLTFSTRSGNTRTPDETWSDWAAAGSGLEGKTITNPKGRFLQYKAEFSATTTKVSPLLKSVRVAYLQQNLRPQVDSITLSGSGVIYRRNQIFQQDSFLGIAEDLPDEQEDQKAGQQAQSGFEINPVGKQEYRKGYQTVTWNASDQNQDELRYSLLYRLEGEKEWRPLANDLKERAFAWDTQTMPDGSYTLKIVVSDAQSNPKGLELQSFKESDPFDVDNSAPNIEMLSKSGNTIEVKASDLFSPIKEMEYSIKTGEWETVFPTDSINDSRAETYRITVPGGTSAIILKCTDRVNNSTTVKFPL